MTDLTPIKDRVDGLPALVGRAANNLANARTSAEVLEARDFASIAYDASKKAARLAKAKGAHDALIEAAHRAQADALEIEARAKQRLADEYDAAQERGEVVSGSVRTDIVGGDNDVRPATAADLGLRRDEIHDARKIRNAEKAEPGIVRETLDRALEEKREPTRAELRRSVLAVAKEAYKPRRKERNPHYVHDPVFRRAAHLSSLCREIHEYDGNEIVQMARWKDIPSTAERLPQMVSAAHATLTRFMKEKNNA